MGSVWVIKRNGEEVEFDAEKISNAIQKANNEVTDDKKLTLLQIADVTRKVVERIEKASHAVNVERIQDLVEIAIMEEGGYEIAQKYVRYRYQREIARKANTTDAEILSLIECSNEEVNQENSNSRPLLQVRSDHRLLPPVIHDRWKLHGLLRKNVHL